MKKIYYLILIFSLSSCSTTLTITGTPYTEIYGPSKTKLGTINTSGYFIKQIPHKERGYYPYFLAKPQGSEKMIPFAPNIEIDNRGDWQFTMLALPFMWPSMIIFAAHGFSWYDDDYYQYIPT